MKSTTFAVDILHKTAPVPLSQQNFEILFYKGTFRFSKHLSTCSRRWSRFWLQAEHGCSSSMDEGMWDCFEKMVFQANYCHVLL